MHRIEPIIKAGKFIELVSGDSGTILFVGSIGEIAIEAGNELKSKGLSVSIASVPFVSNLDRDYLLSAAIKGPIITIEEHSLRGGFGSAILEYLNTEKIYADVGVIASEQLNLTQIGSQEFLRKENNLTSSRIVSEFMAFLES
jgi:transketolase C-terminal domain/subunit